jgi:hypothetical protein
MPGNLEIEKLFFPTPSTVVSLITAPQLSLSPLLWYSVGSEHLLMAIESNELTEQMLRWELVSGTPSHTLHFRWRCPGRLYQWQNQPSLNGGRIAQAVWKLVEPQR